MDCVNYGSTRGLVGKILESEGMRIGGVYMMLAKKNKGV